MIDEAFDAPHLFRADVRNVYASKLNVYPGQALILCDAGQAGIGKEYGQRVSSLSASSYFSLVFSMIAAGSDGPGGLLSQSRVSR